MKETIQNFKLKMKSPGFINYTYIVANTSTKKSVIIDPSWDIKKLLKTIEAQSLTPCAILLTHSHYDHTNLVNSIINIYPNINVYISKKEADYYKFNNRNLVTLKDNEVIQICGITIECYLTPGHTKGSMTYHINNNLYTGDTIFTEGCGICSGEGGSSEEMYYSVQLIKTFDENCIIWPGHAFSLIPGHKLHYILKENLYFVIEDKEVFIKFSERRSLDNAFKFI
ncbi:MBL fold metallo-hydrolase [Staphylococcus cohnii]